MEHMLRNRITDLIVVASVIAAVLDTVEEVRGCSGDTGDESRSYCEMDPKGTATIQTALVGFNQDEGAG